MLRRGLAPVVSILALAAFPSPAADAADARSRVLPTPQGGPGSYTQLYRLGARFRGWTPGAMSRELTSRFSRYFPLRGCGATLTLGERCRLQVPGPDGPVKVVAVAGSGIALRALAGHPEGAGRTVTFRWSRPCSPASSYVYCDRTYLKVNAWGPAGQGSQVGPFNAVPIARRYWTRFAEAIRDRYPRCPSGKAWVASSEACVQEL